ncbi:hypothetical protein [Lysinibacillus sp. RC79]|uniref:hypothetical protein n=1 Tax=Lysinibacillus sp. RC79 TaxID=3156296 RepID=UPI003515E281
MANVSGITIELEFDNKSKLKLRAIAKHAGALADESDRIDNMKECPACGSYNIVTATLIDTESNKALSENIKCADCDYELPTQLEGSD